MIAQEALRGTTPMLLDAVPDVCRVNDVGRIDAGLRRYRGEVALWSVRGDPGARDRIRGEMLRARQIDVAILSRQRDVAHRCCAGGAIRLRSGEGAGDGVPFQRESG